MSFSELELTNGAFLQSLTKYMINKIFNIL